MRFRRFRNRFGFPRFEDAQLVGELRELADLTYLFVPISESERHADEAELTVFLGPPLSFAKLRRAKPDAARPRPNDGRSRRASFRQWLREHTPLVYAALHDDPLLDRARRAQLERLARVRRDALAYCVECHSPLLATQGGFQYCPYKRAGQHEKVLRASGAEEKSNAVCASGLGSDRAQRAVLARSGRATIQRHKPNLSPSLPESLRDSRA